MADGGVCAGVGLRQLSARHDVCVFAFWSRRRSALDVRKTSNQSQLAECRPFISAAHLGQPRPRPSITANWKWGGGGAEARSHGNVIGNLLDCV